MDKSDISLTEHWFFGIFYLVLVKGNKIKFLTIKFKKKKKKTHYPSLQFKPMKSKWNSNAWTERVSKINGLTLGIDFQKQVTIRNL